MLLVVGEGVLSTPSERVSGVALLWLFWRSMTPSGFCFLNDILAHFQTSLSLLASEVCFSLSECLQDHQKLDLRFLEQKTSASLVQGNILIDLLIGFGFHFIKFVYHISERTSYLSSGIVT